MKKYNKFLDVIIFICSAFMFINYFSYLIKLFIWSEGTLPYIVAVLVTLLLPLFIFLHKKGVFAKIFGKAYPFLRSIYAFGLAFYTVSFILLCGYILAAEHNAVDTATLPENTYVVTLGAKVEASGEPGKILRRRLNTTFDILSSREDLKCIVSGGQGSDEPISEAQCMRDYLVRKGISPDRIIIEDKATNTIENIENTLALLEDKGGYGGFAVVTTNFHLPRAEYLCNRLGVDMDKAYFYSAPNTGMYTLYTILVREYMSYCKLFVFGT
ncbi:MAG: YdcF family protein [Ruminococcaceae bacterium]|nr:YdcF family protein [Oscillospiraceae bacterium]